MEKSLSPIWDLLFAPAGTFDPESSHHSRAADALSRNVPVATTRHNHQRENNMSVQRVEDTRCPSHCNERSGH
jgi:hypothetical protein